MAAVHLFHARAEVDIDTLIAEHLGDVTVGAVGERLQQCVAKSTR